MIKFIHSELAAGGWSKYSLEEQLGNVGSDVDRAIRWKEKGNQEYFQKAFDRAIELMDLTIMDKRWKKRLRELCRARDVVCDYLVGNNEYGSTAASLSKYFYHYALAARHKKDFESATKELTR